jgi:hypothetical protein
MLVGASGPSNQSVPVTASSNLTVTTLVFHWSWHGRVICGAHDVLAKSIKTVIDVKEIEGLFFAIVFGDDSLTDEFLAVLAWSIIPLIDDLRGSVSHVYPLHSRCCAQYPTEIE